MADWLNIELVLGVVMVTSFVSVGLLTLWAATSPRHWLLRCAAVLGVLSPLLMVPAYELWIVFALEACVVMTGVLSWRWCVASHHVRVNPPKTPQPSNRRLRFSLRSLLAIAPLVAARCT